MPPRLLLFWFRRSSHPRPLLLDQIRNTHFTVDFLLCLRSEGQIFLFFKPVEAYGRSRNSADLETIQAANPLACRELIESRKMVLVKVEPSPPSKSRLVLTTHPCVAALLRLLQPVIKGDVSSQFSSCGYFCYFRDLYNALELGSLRSVTLDRSWKRSKKIES